MARTRPSPSRAEGRSRPAPSGRKGGPVEIALAALSRRRRTSHEILEILRRRGVSAAEAEAAVARLGDLGYVDDPAYAAAFAGTVAREKSWGPRRVRRELARRGLSAEAIDEGLARAEEEGAAPAGNIGRAVARLTRVRGMPRDRRGLDRLRAALARRGFDPDAIAAALAGCDEDPGEEIGEEP